VLLRIHLLVNDLVGHPSALWVGQRLARLRDERVRDDERAVLQTPLPITHTPDVRCYSQLQKKRFRVRLCIKK
jgi:hypothetical protein